MPDEEGAERTIDVGADEEQRAMMHDHILYSVKDTMVEEIHENA